MSSSLTTRRPRPANAAFVALLALTGVLYLWNLSASGYANEFYAAAVKSSTLSWKAWLFASIDSANAITVDKPPASIWVMGLFGRLFGFSSWSMLVPQALMGVASVALVHASVKRVAGAATGLVAGTLLALTPVAALMFRFNNPDALLVLLMTLAAWMVTRAIDAVGRRRALGWLIGAGAAIGFAFLTKMLQGLLVLPAFALAYLLAARWRLGTRLAHLLAALAAVVVGSGWFVALVSLWPADARPYIGGSTNNSLWQLALGYNGLGRILGGTGNGGGGGSFAGTAGIARLFNSQFGGEISWTIPAALVLLVAGLVARGRASLADRVRAALVLWGGWLVVTGLVLSFMEGTVHSYYAVALAPALAAVIALGGREVVRLRTSLAWRGVLSGAVLATGAWSFALLTTLASGWLPGLRWVVLGGSVVGAVAWLVAPARGRAGRLGVAALALGVVASLGGTTAWTAATALSAHQGSMPVSGPGVAASGAGAGGLGGGGGRPTGGERGGADGPGGETSSEVVTLLDSAGTRWSAAVVGAQSAAGYILSSDTAVMAIGGFTGSDDSPTLAEFQAYVASGQIHYFLNGGDGGGRGGGSAAQIQQWVAEHYTSTTIGGVTVYDLTQAAD